MDSATTDAVVAAADLIGRAGATEFEIAWDCPHTPDQGDIHEELRAAAKAYVAVLDRLCPPSREASLAFTSVQESLMWANAAVAIHDSSDMARQA